MSATKEIDFTKLGIIAGGGALPAYLIDICKNKGITPFIVGFDAQSDPEIMNGNVHLWTGMGSVGKIIEFFKSNNVTDLVLIGNVKRPSFTEIKPDLKAMQMISRIGFKALGDNKLLSALKSELEAEGFTLHGIHDFCDGLLINEGRIGKYEPKQEDLASIDFGLKASQAIGALDIGQSVIVQNAMVIGVEAVEGTDALINRCKSLQQSGRGGILVKTCKPQQDKKLDMPTIGVQTIENAHKAGLCGIVAQAGNVIIIDIKNVAKVADKHKMFVVGMPIKSNF